MIEVCIAYAPAARTVIEETLQLSAPATVRMALLASRLPERFPQVDWQALTPGVWSRAADWDDALSDGDRVELCRPLLVDPKTARRQRFSAQGARGTGLFARRRQGGKAGY